MVRTYKRLPFTELDEPLKLQFENEQLKKVTDGNTTKLVEEIAQLKDKVGKLETEKETLTARVESMR